MVTSFLRISTSQQQSPKKSMKFERPSLHFPFPKTSPGDTWTQSVVTNFLSFNPRQY